MQCLQKEVQFTDITPKAQRFLPRLAILVVVVVCNQSLSVFCHGFMGPSSLRGSLLSSSFYASGSARLPRAYIALFCVCFFVFGEKCRLENNSNSKTRLNIAFITYTTNCCKAKQSQSVSCLWMVISTRWSCTNGGGDGDYGTPK